MTSLAFYADIEGAYDTPKRIGQLSSVISAIGDSSPVVIGGGDTIGPSLLSVATEGRGSIAFYNSVSADIDVLGNHEFDYGLEPLQDIIQQSPQTWLAANLRDDSDFFPSCDSLTDWTTIEKGGTHLGIFGVSHPNTAAMAPNANGLRFDDPLESAITAVRHLRNEDVDWVIGVSHAGDDREIARRTEVDLLLGGHNNDQSNESVAGTTVVHTSGEAREVVVVRLDDEVGPVVRRHPTSDAPVDSVLVEQLHEFRQATDLETPVGQCTSPLYRGRRCDGRLVGNIVADALYSQSNSDAAIVNSGAIRAGPPLNGTLTVGDILETIPFPQPVVLVELSGSELFETVVEAAGRYADADETEDWHAYVAGMEIAWNATEERVERLTIDGKPIRPDASYRVATLLYVVVSNHLFQTIDQSHRIGTVGQHHQVIAAHVDEYGVNGSVMNRIEIIDSY